MTIRGYRISRKASQLWEQADEAGELPAYTAILTVHYDSAKDEYSLLYRLGAKPKTIHLALSFARGFLLAVEMYYDDPFTPINGD